MHAGAVTYVLELLGKKRISLSRAAELLGCSTLAIVQKAHERGIVLGATVEQYAKAKASVRSKSS